MMRIEGLAIMGRVTLCLNRRAIQALMRHRWRSQKEEGRWNEGCGVKNSEWRKGTARRRCLGLPRDLCDYGFWVGDSFVTCTGWGAPERSACRGSGSPTGMIRVNLLPWPTVDSTAKPK